MKIKTDEEKVSDIQMVRIYQRNMELLIKVTRFFNDTEGMSVHPLSHILLEKITEGCWNYLISLQRKNGYSIGHLIKAKHFISEAVSVIDILIDKTPELNETLNEIMDRVDMMIKMVNWSIHKARIAFGKIAA